MGSSGKDLTGYVDGLVVGDTIATWRVDGRLPYSLIGGSNAYFGWTEFSAKELLNRRSMAAKLPSLPPMASRSLSA